MNAHEFGQWCEEQAARYLAVTRGWQVMARRVRYREGELDLVMEGADGALYFVEVKGIRSRRYGCVVERLTTQKVQRLRRAIGRWKRETGERRLGRLVFVGVERRAGQTSFEVREVE